MRKAFRGTGRANPGRRPALQAVFLADVLLGLVSFGLNTFCGETLKTTQLQRSITYLNCASRLGLQLPAFSLHNTSHWHLLLGTGGLQLQHLKVLLT